ncbi:Flp family type IVb pilin [Phenylobacterium sp.]|uniref:Flp family type IVb pilin n=1 Tax=Phenylobacterium sp. TaxID=1871053 RepID=UPI0035AF65B0
MNKFVSFFKDESGASAAEYVLILAIIGSAIAASALGLGNAISAALNRASVIINGQLN